LRIMVDTASLRLTEVTLGIIPGAGGTQRLPRLIGKSRAKEYILCAKPMPAKDAHDMGLVHRLLPATGFGNGDYHAELIKQAEAWGKEIAQSAPLALAAAKSAIDQGFDRDLESGLALETKSYLGLINTSDRTEGLLAFAEKRKPVYSGK
jgi:methylglutaconyl-CoA hydratase